MATRQSTETKATGAIRSSGRRLTQQRALLLELIEASAEHLDAEELYELAKARDKRISLSTVYRTLSLLKSLDLVDELHLAENHRHYETKPQAEHYHLVCLGCGTVMEFQSPLAENLHQVLVEQYGFQATSTRVEISGYCSACRTTRGIQRAAESHSYKNKGQNEQPGTGRDHS